MLIKIRHSWFIFVLLFCSCNSETIVWQQSKTVPDCMWNKNEAVEFTVPVKDTLSWYSISINLRNRTDYAFQNLYLFIKTKSPDGGFTVDTLNYMLARDDGSWTGSGGLFSMYKENVFLYRKYVKFPVKGDYTVNIIHGMREDNLQGIASVGLILQ